MSEKNGITLVLGALVIICTYVVASIMLATLMAYVLTGLVALSVLFVIGVMWRKWQHSGLLLKQHKLEQQKAADEKDLEVQRIANEEKRIAIEHMEAQARIAERQREQDMKFHLLSRYVDSGHFPASVSIDGSYTYHPPVKQIATKEEQKQLVAASQAAIVRPTQQALLAQLPQNGYLVSPGVNASTGKIVMVNILDVPHMKIIGASGFGKSCLAAAIMDQLTQAHDARHLQLALLDLEHKTSRLFECNNNIARLRVNGRIIDLVATNADMVALHLGFLKRELTRRTQLSQDELERQPVILIYVEEMLALQYEVDPKLLAQMINDILILAVRARKYFMFLLSCMQTDYSTDEMKVSQKMYRFRSAAAIDTTAARAAGFMNTELVKENFQNGLPGQFVVEYPGFSSLVIAPDYDVKQLLGGETSSADRRAASVFSRTEVRAPVKQYERDYQEAPDCVIVDADEYEMEPLRERPGTAPASAQIHLVPPVEGSDFGPEKGQTAGKEYRLTETEISSFIAAYKVSGSIEKVLSAIGRGSRYKAHASEIVRAFNLRKDA